VKVRPAAGIELDEAMKRVVEVADRAALLRHLEEHYGFWKPTTDNVTIEPYGFDERIGWNTHIVCVDGKAALFSDGPFPGA
jgi:hypothetical protein